MLVALTLFSCGCSGASPEDVLLPHRRHNYVFHFSPLTYTCNENAEVGGGGQGFSSPASKSPTLGTFLKHSLGGDTCG